MGVGDFGARVSVGCPGFGSGFRLLDSGKASVAASAESAASGMVALELEATIGAGDWMGTSEGISFPTSGSNSDKSGGNGGSKAGFWVSGEFEEEASMCLLRHAWSARRRHHL